MIIIPTHAAKQIEIEIEIIIHFKVVELLGRVCLPAS